MKKKLLTLIFSLITLCSLPFGQASLSAQSFIGKLNPNPNPTTRVLADDTVKILAVMVNFQADKDGATFGDGKFGSIYTQSYGNNILDPLPHDSSYFDAHLTFVKNYFQKVSNGKTSLKFTILPDTFSVSKTMRNYSPTPGSADFTPMGQYAQEVWTNAEQQRIQKYPWLNFPDYDLFVIFHAGVGRDISLPGSIGNERDLPSVYLSEISLKNIFGQTFSGFPVSNGSFNIKNSMIIPETESRELETFSGKFLFEITINGLIAASVASHLGLPDLFDTETGLSAIGRFGLMDGQSIFAYNGCFPPEPSAWEKIYLGWAEPVEISPGNFSINLTANLAATFADTVILKVPLNSSEYYLIENRQRDVPKDGAKLRYKSNGNIIDRTFLKDTTGFYSYDTDSLSGVVIDVDEFDWALPGNGIVIWHIDENVINQKLAENKINTDKTKRGVDVEEADGVQDIGERFITIFGDEVIGEGTQEDYWYAGNKAKLFKNKFAKDTRPDTKTNSGANSLITIKDFSSISNKMSFKIEYGDSVIKPVFSTSIQTSSLNNNITFYENGTSSGFIFKTDSSLLTIDKNGNQISTPMNFVSSIKPATYLWGDVDYVFQPEDSTVSILMESGTDSNIISVDGRITTEPVLIEIPLDGPYIVFGTDRGEVLTYMFGDPWWPPMLFKWIKSDTLYTVEKIAANDTLFAFITTPGPEVIFIDVPVYFYQDNSGNKISFSGEKPLDIAMTKDKNGNYISIVLTNQNKFYVIQGSAVLNSFIVNASEPINSFSLADLKRDGENYIIFSNGNQVEARNLIGALADNFPFSDPENIGFSGTPLSADFENDNNAEVLAFTKDGRIFAIDGGSGKVINGFPLSTGVELISTPILYRDNGIISLAAFDKRNNLTAWNISPAAGTLYWSEKNGNNYNSSFINTAASQNLVNTFFPTSRAYNYPNPVYDG
ncbi:MAG: hypothetical protein Q8M94_06820, partial [Ignavibacteria bacterium]|nr:hypothetical protein [Ignavibacteria bacterium]